MLGRVDIEDESGTSMVELVVGMGMGMVVLAGMAMLLIVVLHGNARVDARVEATDNARIAVTRITEELHSACTTHGFEPVRESSTSEKLIFRHAAAGKALEAEPEAVETIIAYDAGTKTLTQTDHTAAGWEAPRTLLTNVAPAGEHGVFTYSYYDSAGELQPWSSPTSRLPKELAERIILVNVALTASPRSTPVADAGAAASVKSSASLRLTPPPFEPGALVKPCE